MNVAQLRALGGTFRLAAPLTASGEEILRGVEIVDQAIEEVSPRFV